MANPFKGKANNSSGAGVETPEAGNHPAVLVAMVDLGTHEDEYQGVTKKQRKVYLAWELTAEKMSGTKDRNHVIGKEFTLSFHKKGKLREVAESLRGQAYPDDADIDFTKMLGAACLASVELSESSSGNKYAKLKTVARLAKGMTAPKALHKPFFWSVEDDAIEALEANDWLPFIYGEKVSDKIKRSDEWKARRAGDGEPAGDEIGGDEPVGAGVGGSNNDIPF